ncbi:MAG TPA: MBL fold metallo-hydrolase [Anaerolineaceae bacterium]|nr:MBL fold metallo-hydrolase [Anaerolineaceae bacterium]
MDNVVVLGSANAVPDSRHDNTHLLIQAGKTNVLVDCASSPVQRLEKAGTSLESINNIFFTHFHPDHVAGAPLLFMVMWLKGRSVPLHLYGLEITLQKIRQAMELYDYHTWPGMFPLAYHFLPEVEGYHAFEDENLFITTSPVKHLIPTIGLRVDYKDSRKSLMYTCDTEPCPAVISLAHKVDILLHEAAGNARGHSSPQQAAEDARAADSRSLVLIHYDYSHPELAKMVEQARQIFPGEVSLAQDFMQIGF